MHSRAKPAHALEAQTAASRLRPVLSTAALAVLVALTCTASAGAESFAVNDATDAPLANSGGTACESTHGSTCTLRAAVQAAANSGGVSTIMLPAGQYTLTGPIPIDGALNALAIAGAAVAETIVTTNKRGPAFEVPGGKSLSISGLTIEDSGHEFAAGGGILNDGNLTVTGSALRHNVGGAIESAGLSVSVIDSTVEGNRASVNGGAFSLYDGSLILAGDTIMANSATHGGKGGVLFAREHTPQPVEVIDSTIAKNEGALGGGLWLRGDGAVEAGKLTITGSDFEENTSENEGGAVFDEAFGPIEVDRSKFSGDEAAAGGAIAVEQSGPLSIGESTFSEDKSSHNGGAIVSTLTDVAVSRSTFVRNSSSEEGGAIFAGYGLALDLVNDTFEGNRAVNGGALGLPGAGEAPAAEQLLLNDTIVRNEAQDGGGLAPFQGPGYPNLVIENTIVAQNSGGDCYRTTSLDNTASADAGGNIDSDGSCFSEGVTGDRTGVAEPALGVAELASNGGPAETDALTASSPAIGAGVSGSCPATDERGVNRTGEPCDSGAYRFVTPASPPASSGSATTAPGATPKAPSGPAPCRSARVETINWRVPRGVRLGRVTVTLDGRIYRTLPRGARSVRVSLLGLPMSTVSVRIAGIARSHAAYGTARVFHPCAPAKRVAPHLSSYLRRLSAPLARGGRRSGS